MSCVPRLRWCKLTPHKGHSPVSTRVHHHSSESKVVLAQFRSFSRVLRSPWHCDVRGAARVLWDDSEWDHARLDGQCHPESWGTVAQFLSRSTLGEKSWRAPLGTWLLRRQESLSCSSQLALWWHTHTHTKLKTFLFASANSELSFFTVLLMTSLLIKMIL